MVMAEQFYDLDYCEQQLYRAKSDASVTVDHIVHHGTYQPKTSFGGCVTQVDYSVLIRLDWRWIHADVVEWEAEIRQIEMQDIYSEWHVVPLNAPEAKALVDYVNDDIHAGECFLDGIRTEMPEAERFVGHVFIA